MGSLFEKEEKPTVLKNAVKKRNLAKVFNEKGGGGTRMNIFVCGENFPDNFYSYITGLTEQPPLNRITMNYKGRGGEERTVEVENYKHPNEILDWDYYYFREGELEENRIHEILSVIKSNYIDKKEENNVLIVVSQIDNTDELNRFIKKIYDLIYPPPNDNDDNVGNNSSFLGIVEVIFMNCVRINYFDLYIIDDDKLTDDDDLKYDKRPECGREKILKVLFEKCSYLNQLGDSLIFPSDLFPREAEEEEDIIKNIYGNTLNIVIMGDRGCGKSTLINKILGEKKAQIGKSKDITQNITLFFKNRVSFFDLPGSNGKEDDDIYIDLIKKNNEDKSDLYNVHAIFYTINAQCMRPSYEVIRNILESFPKIKLYILLTKTGTNRREVQRTLGSFRNTLEEKLGERYRCLVDCVFPLEFKSKENGLRRLLERVHEDFTNYKIDINQIRNLETVDLMIRKIRKSDFFFNVKSFDDLIKLKKINFMIYTIKVEVYYSLFKPAQLEEQRELFIRIGRCFGLEEEQSRQIINDYREPHRVEKFFYHILFGELYILFPISCETTYFARKAQKLFEKQIKRDDDSKKNFIFSQVNDLNEVIDGIKGLIPKDNNNENAG